MLWKNNINYFISFLNVISIFFAFKILWIRVSKLSIYSSRIKNFIMVVCVIRISNLIWLIWARFSNLPYIRLLFRLILISLIIFYIKIFIMSQPLIYTQRQEIDFLKQNSFYILFTFTCDSDIRELLNIYFWLLLFWSFLLS